METILLFTDMKDKIFNSLKQTYSHLGLGDTVLQTYAETMDATGLVTEDNLETLVKGQENILKAFQSNLDKSRSEHAAVKKELDELKGRAGGGDPTKKEPEKKDDEPDWFKAYREKAEKELSEMKKENESFKAEREKTERASKITAKAKELNIPEWRIKEGFTIPDDADDTTITNALTGVKQNLVNAGLEGRKEAYPVSGTLEKEKEEAEAWAKTLPDRK
jgi:hypothetical protein